MDDIKLRDFENSIKVKEAIRESLSKMYIKAEELGMFVVHILEKDGIMNGIVHQSAAFFT